MRYLSRCYSQGIREMALWLGALAVLAKDLGLVPSDDLLLLASKDTMSGLGSNSGHQAWKQVPLPSEPSPEILSLWFLIHPLYSTSSSLQIVRGLDVHERCLIIEHFVLTCIEGCKTTQDPVVTKHVY